MDISNVITAIEQLIQQKNEEQETKIKKLTSLEKQVLSLSLEGKSYEEMLKELRKEDDSEYKPKYIQQSLGPKLWKKLEEVLGVDKITKNTLKDSLGKLDEFSESSSTNKLFNQSEPVPLTAQKIVPQSSLGELPYVERPPNEQNCYELIEEPGNLIYVHGPDKIGKTSFLQKILQHAIINKKYHTIYLNLGGFSDQLLNDQALDKEKFFYTWFCNELSREFEKTSLQKSRFNNWDETVSESQKCTNYLHYILKNVETPLILGLDDIDRLYNSETIAISFLKLIRSWIETARSFNDINLPKLRIIITYSQEPPIDLDDDNSPFNLGDEIELKDFNEEQTRDLCNLYSLDWDKNKVQKFLDSIGGNPKLIQKALNYLKNRPEEDFDDFLKKSITEEGIYQRELKNCYKKLTKNYDCKEALISELKKVINSKDKPIEINNFEIKDKLNNIGLITFTENKVELRYELYRSYLSKYL